MESKNIVFPREEHRFSLSSKYGTGMDSEMTQDILFESELKYFSRLKHADTVGAIKAFKKGVLYHGEDCNRGPKNDPSILEPAFLLVNR